MAHVRQTARLEASGISVESPFWFVFEVDGTKVTKLSFYARQKRSPRSRRAAGVGGVAGERGGDAKHTAA